MPQYIVRKMASTRDGSQLGRSQTVVNASNPELARQQGAELLETSPSLVTVHSFTGYGFQVHGRPSEDGEVEIVQPELGGRPNWESLA